MTAVSSITLPWILETNLDKPKGLQKFDKLITAELNLLREIYQPIKDSHAVTVIFSSFKELQGILDIGMFVQSANQIINGNPVFKEICGFTAASVDCGLALMSNGIANLNFVKTFASQSIGRVSFFSVVNSMTQKEILGKIKDLSFLCLVGSEFYGWGKQIWNKSGESLSGKANAVHGILGADIAKKGFIIATKEVLFNRDSLLTIAGQVTKLWLIAFAAQATLVKIACVCTATYLIGSIQYTIKEATNQKLLAKV